MKPAELHDKLLEAIEKGLFACKVDHDDMSWMASIVLGYVETVVIGYVDSLEKQVTELETEREEIFDELARRNIELF